MVNKKKVVITVDKGGKITVQAEGYKGASCLPVVDQIQAALGGDVVESVDTDEMFEVVKETEHETVGGEW